MASDMMVEILTGVGLIIHQETLIAEPQILDEDSVAWELLVAPVDDLDAPEPRVQSRVQPEGDPVANAVLRSLPDIAVVRGADAKRRLWAHDGRLIGRAPPVRR